MCEKHPLEGVELNSNLKLFSIKAHQIYTTLKAYDLQLPGCFGYSRVQPAASLGDNNLSLLLLLLLLLQ
jgi:hypothetical protein